MVICTYICRGIYTWHEDGTHGCPIRDVTDYRIQAQFHLRRLNSAITKPYSSNSYITKVVNFGRINYDEVTVWYTNPD